MPTLRLATSVDALKFKNDTRAYGVYSLPVTWQERATLRARRSAPVTLETLAVA